MLVSEKISIFENNGTLTYPNDFTDSGEREDEKNQEYEIEIMTSSDRVISLEFIEFNVTADDYAACINNSLKIYEGYYRIYCGNTKPEDFISSDNHLKMKLTANGFEGVSNFTLKWKSVQRENEGILIYQIFRFFI